MSAWQIWLTILGLALVTVVTRGFFLFMGTRIRLPGAVQRALRYAPVAALVAILVPELLAVEGGRQAGIGLQSGPWFLSEQVDWMGFLSSHARLFAAAAAVIVFWYRRGMLLAISIGMLIYTVLR